MFGGSPPIVVENHINALPVTVVIPTKNRRTDLLTAFRSLLRQTVLPIQVVVVDQSPDDSALQCLKAELTALERVRLEYVYDPSLNGAAAARNRAMDLATGDIWLFVDDDVVLEPDFVEKLLVVYREEPKIAGVSGVITNYPRPSVWFRAWNKLFMRGPFRDERQPVYWNANQLRDSPPIPVPWFTGCLMSFRAEAARSHRFERESSWRVRRRGYRFLLELRPSYPSGDRPRRAARASPQSC